MTLDPVTGHAHRCARCWWLTPCPVEPAAGDCPDPWRCPECGDRPTGQVVAPVGVWHAHECEGCARGVWCFDGRGVPECCLLPARCPWCGHVTRSGVPPMVTADPRWWCRTPAPAR